MLGGIIKRLKPNMQVFSGETQPIECKPGDTRKECKLKKERLQAENATGGFEDALKRELSRLSPDQVRELTAHVDQETAKLKAAKAAPTPATTTEAQTYVDGLMRDAREQLAAEQAAGIRVVDGVTQSGKVTSEWISAEELLRGDFE